MHVVATNVDIRRDLVAAGRRLVGRFTWPASAAEHRAIYSRLLRPARTA
jgi:hypothetical protein